MLVPTGKRLVIEFVGVDVNVPSGQKVLAAVGTTLGSATLFHPIVTATLPGVGGQDVFRASQPVRLYADPGTSVGLFITRAGTVGAGHAVVTVSGHLVDLP